MNSLKQVIDLSIEQAKYYLENAGEFYPFGTIEHVDGQLQPVGMTTGEDYPDSKELISLLVESITGRILQKKLRAGAVGVDALISLPEFKEKVSVVEIKAIDEQGNALDCYLPYVIADNKPFYRELISRSGTLSF